MNIYKIVTQTGIVLLAVGMLLTLTACKQDFIVRDANNIIVGEGTLEVSANFPSPAYVDINGRKFSGHWRATRVYEADVAKRHQLLGTRSYAEYVQGNARDQLWHAQANLTEQNGTEMLCDFYYRRQPESGSCNLEGTVLKLVILSGDEIIP